MQRIVVSPFRFDWSLGFGARSMLSTLTSNMDSHDRHGFEIFFAVSIFAYMGGRVWVTWVGKKGKLDASP
jgi:hypothetical protein